MALIDFMMADCVIMNKTKTSDGEGGFIDTWAEGDAVKVAITHNTTLNARIAEKEGLTSTYTLTTKKAVKLDLHDVIKRVSDGQYFRVTSDPDDIVSPTISSLDIRQVTAERWALT